MKLGRFTIEQLSEGRFEIFTDGSINREPVDTTDENRDIKETRRNSVRIGINPILVADEKHKILLDTGLGWGLDAGSAYKDVSNVVSNLDIFGVKPEDITHVVLSHLHYDHSAGSSFTNSATATCATFPNANYLVQKREWEYALEIQGAENKPNGADYRLDDLYRLVADRRITFLEGDYFELPKGVKILWTGGHTAGHQAVRIEDRGQIAYYLGDLLPGENHLNHYAMRQMDQSPLQAKKMKTKLLRRAYKEKAVLLFYHSLYSSLGHLEKDEHEKYVLKELK